MNKENLRKYLINQMVKIYEDSSIKPSCTIAWAIGLLSLLTKQCLGIDRQKENNGVCFVQTTDYLLSPFLFQQQNALISRYKTLWLQLL